MTKRVVILGAGTGGTMVENRLRRRFDGCGRAAVAAARPAPRRSVRRRRRETAN